MRIIKITSVLFLLSGFLLGTTSCLVTYRTDNGNHRGWHKNRNNPHNPVSTNPGHGHGRNK